MSRFQNSFTGEKVTVTSEYPLFGEMKTAYTRDNPQEIGVLKMVEDKLTLISKRKQSQFVKPKRVFDKVYSEI